MSSLAIGRDHPDHAGAEGMKRIDQSAPPRRPPAPVRALDSISAYTT
ncbi:MAG: hypothetical protein M3550_10860 [Actinomycetota bacterium]|nr:hypothetical protein [Actinomycetota bacterium]